MEPRRGVFRLEIGHVQDKMFLVYERLVEENPLELHFDEHPLCERRSTNLREMCETLQSDLFIHTSSFSFMP